MNLRHNTKLYSLIFLLVFLAAQVALVSHTIKHGVLEHIHAGKQCEQCVFAKYYNADTPTSISVNLNFTEYKIAYITHKQGITASYLLDNNPTRAPPILLT